ncbi:MAG: HAD-IA family hydrolase [bacterium]|nr:HAD-IA family hydrolase [bacterium]
MKGTGCKVQVVVFDFDDTLCMTEEACFNLENCIAGKLGFGPMSREAHQRNWGTPIHEAIAERIPGIDTAAFFEIYEETHRKFISAGLIDVVPEENLALLWRLKKAGKKTAILTSRTKPESLHLLSTDHPLYRRIDSFYYRERYEHPKPHPKAFEGLLKEFRVKPEQALYIGDSPNDALSAKSAGLFFIASLESGLRSPEDFAPGTTDAFVNQLIDIEGIISNL